MTTPIPQATQPWKWDYNPEGDEWLLLTPEYDPMTSFRVTRSREFGRLIFALYRGSTMPREVAEVLAQSINRLRLFELADKHTWEIIQPPEEILKAAANVKRLWCKFPMGEAPASYFMRQGE